MDTLFLGIHPRPSKGELPMDQRIRALPTLSAKTDAELDEVLDYGRTLVGDEKAQYIQRILAGILAGEIGPYRNI